jgi:hypothetical protein
MNGEQGARGVDGGAKVPEGGWSRGWFFVARASALLRADRGMQVVAVLGGLLTAAAALAVFGGLDHLLGGLALHRDDPGRHVSLPLVLAVLGVPITFASTFTNVMLVAMAQAHLDGGRMTVRAALAFAGRRLPAILGWSLLAVTVGALMRVISERIPFVGPLLAFVGDVTWAVAAMFAIPALVVEDVGPVTAAKRSVAVFRARWGEGISGSVQVGGVSLALIVPGVVLLAVGLIGDAMAFTIAGVALLAVGLALAKALSELFALALYRDEVLGAGAFGLAGNQLDAFVDTKGR